MTKINLLIIISIFHFIANGQVLVKSDNYAEMESGVYKTKSLDTLLIHQNLPKIKSQKEFNESKEVAFLQIQDKKIVLFDRIGKDSGQKAIGFLNESTIVEIDTIFYNRIYKDPTKDWFLTFDVWYGLRIDGNCYYTDFKIHDFIAYETKLKEFDQKFFLVAQNTGYDGLYDNGYPEYFFVVVLNSENQIVFQSKLLDFNYGDEFWESEFNITTEINKNGNFEFTILGIDESYSGIWTGNELKKNTAGNKG